MRFNCSRTRASCAGSLHVARVDTAGCGVSWWGLMASYGGTGFVNGIVIAVSRLAAVCSITLY